MKKTVRIKLFKDNGRYNAPLQLAHRLARYFGRSIEEVFLFEEE